MFKMKLFRLSKLVKKMRILQSVSGSNTISILCDVRITGDVRLCNNEMKLSIRERKPAYRNATGGGLVDLKSRPNFELGLFEGSHLILRRSSPFVYEGLVEYLVL